MKARSCGAVLRSRSTRCCDRDRCEGEIAIGDDESGSRTIGFGVRRERSVLGCDENHSKSKSNGGVEGCDSKSKSKGFGLWVQSLSGCDLSGRSLAGGRGVLSPFLFFLYLTLTKLSLSVFWKMVFEGKIKMEIILHPNTRSTEKHFRKCYFPCANKHPHLRKSISGNDFHQKQTQP